MTRPAGGARMQTAEFASMRTRFEERLMGWLPLAGSHPPVLHEAMRYACADGKRVRPLLCLGAAIACGGTEDLAIAPAIALELVHCYSLVHDDLPAMDDDTLRRGRPTLHVQFGEAQAILAGDALLTKAFEALTESRLSALSPQTRVELARELAVASGSTGMAGGQADELALGDATACAGESQGSQDATGVRIAADQTRRIASLKTGALLKAAARMGAIAAGASERHLSSLTRFGELFGLAYQVVDDLGDETKDRAIGRRLNFAITLGRASATDMARSLCDEAVSELESDHYRGSTAVLLQLVDMLRAGITG